MEYRGYLKRIFHNFSISYVTILNMDNSYFERADQYISDLLMAQDPVLAATQQSIIRSGMHDISVSPSQGKLLQVLATLCNAGKILELGTFFGYSAISLARALPAGGQLVTIEYDPAIAAIARTNFTNAGLGDKIQVRIGKALDILPLIAEEGIAPFDMIFIDADKESYPAYFEWALRLSRPGTLIVADNVIRHLYDPGTTEEKRAGVARFNQLLAESSAVTATIIQNVGIKEPDGMAIAVVK